MNNPQTYNQHPHHPALQAGDGHPAPRDADVSGDRGHLAEEALLGLVWGLDMVSWSHVLTDDCIRKLELQL